LKRIGLWVKLAFLHYLRAEVKNVSSEFPQKSRFSFLSEKKLSKWERGPDEL